MFLFSSRFTRLYALAPSDLRNQWLLRFLGVPSNTVGAEIFDYSESVSCTFNTLSEQKLVRPKRVHILLFRALRLARLCLPLSLLLRLIDLVPARKRKQLDSGDLIGKNIHSLEVQTGLSNCYLRSLFIFYLAKRADVPCRFYVGAILPAPKLHAWCVLGRSIPYESDLEYFNYRPLFAAAIGCDK